MNNGVKQALRTILARKPLTTDFQSYYGRLLIGNSYAPTADEARRDVEQSRSTALGSSCGL